MIAYEDLCTALDRYNRRLRGELVPDAEAQYHGEDVEFVEDQVPNTQPPPHPSFGANYGAGGPDITAETELPPPFPGGQDPYRQ